MPGRSFTSSNYRYGFNGKENDPETVGTGQGTQDCGMRIYNPSLGKFLSVDPLAKEYPWYTPYQFAGNKPIQYIDIDGMEEGALYTQMYSELGFYPDAPGEQTAKDMWIAAKPALKKAGGIVLQAYLMFLLTVNPVVAEEAVLAAESKALLAESKAASTVESKIVTANPKTIAKLETKAATEEVIATKQAGANSGIKTNGQKSFSPVKQAAPCGCFTELTLIATKNGLKKIVDVIVGDSVLSYNEKTEQLSYRRVLKTFKVTRDSLYKIHIGNEVIEATADHPFFIGKKWIKVKELKVGQDVQLYDQTRIKISRIEIQTGIFEAYNFEVEENHTYYIASQKILVHNAGPCDFELVNITAKGADNKTLPSSSQINSEIKKIVNGGGTRQMDNGVPSVFQNRNNKPVELKWHGAEEFNVNVPGASDKYRILRLQTGTASDGTPAYKYGYTYDHYSTVHEFKPVKTDTQ